MTTDHQPARDDLWGIRLLRQYLRPRGALLACLALLLLASATLAVISPQLLRRFIDAINGTAVPDLLELGAVFLAVALLAEVCWVIADCLGAHVAWSVTNELRADLTSHCLNLDSSFYEKHSGGTLIGRLDGDVAKLANYFSQMFLLVVSNLLVLFGIGIALLLQDWRLGLCYIPFIAGSVLLLRRLMGAAIPAVVAQRQADAELLGFLEERVGGLEDLRANGARHHVVQGFWLGSAGLLTASRRAARLGVRWPAAAQGMAALGLALSLVAGVWLFLTGQATLGSAYMLVAYAGMLQFPLLTVVFQMQDLEEAMGAIRRISELLEERSAVADGPDRLSAREPGTGLAITFDRVSFGYRPDEPVLRDISFHLAPGRRLAIAGRSGSGKSTIARLLMRFMDASQGRVLFGDQDVRDLTVASVREQVALVTQEVQIFYASVRDNVTLFDDEVPDSRIAGVLDEVGLGPWLARLPSGLDTLLGAGAVGLSGGEAQLLAASRVLIADPGLVILDEAASRLDPESRAAFETVQHRLLRGRTAIIVTHRADEVRAADEVLVLKDGRAMEHGERDALLADADSKLASTLRSGGIFA